jgi:hypothetical protein
MSYRILILIGFLLPIPCAAQGFGLQRNNSIPVNQAGVELRNAWTGGLNAPQFSPIDINQDGKTDLFIFEKTGNRIYIFLNEGGVGESIYRNAPELSLGFPELQFWALLRDYNNDGKPDIFSSAGNGIKIHRNQSETPPYNQFILEESLLSSNYNPFELNLFVSPVDLPAIDDIDGDGDLDILTFYILGTCVEYHRNLSVEQQGNSDLLRYRLETQHWGNFTEDFLTNNVNLNDSCGGFGLNDDIVRHSGSTLCTFDANNDQVKDLLIGGIGYSVINFLLNGGTSQQANIISSTFNFPASQPVNLQSFPGAFIMDVNNDGKRDLLVAPNTDIEAENKTGVLLYLNEGEDLQPDFQFAEGAFLQKEMLDFGTGAYPVFFDFDQDGDLDLVVGNAGYYTPQGLKGQIAVYRNIGSNANPSYRLISDDLANISNLNLRYLFPTFADLDGDGREDMLLGTQQGNLLHFKNISISGDAEFELQTDNYQGINTGTFSAPQFFDLDRDGRNDLIIGNRSGRLSYFRNNGNASSAQFNTLPDNDFLGNVRTVKSTESNFGYATPCFIRLQDSTFLVCGSESGFIYVYGGIDNNLNGSFSIIDSTLTGKRFGKMIAVAARDLNNDQMPEFIIGNAAGGLEFFDGVSPMNINALTPAAISIYPNPAQDYFVWQASQPFHNLEFMLFDLSGRLIKRFVSQNQQEGIIYLDSELNNGLYLLSAIYNKQNINTYKIIIAK